MNGQRDSSICKVLGSRVILGVDHRFVIEMSVTVGGPMDGIAVVGLGFIELDSGILARNQVVAGESDRDVRRGEADVVEPDTEIAFSAHVDLKSE